jgi:hypothetical protein
MDAEDHQGTEEMPEVQEPLLEQAEEAPSEGMMASSGARPTEPTYASDLKEWINEIVVADGLPFSEAKVELTKEKKRSDILLFDKRRGCSLVIEIKRPEESPTDAAVVKQAGDYADQYRSNGLRYFATHNVNTLVLWDALTKRRVDEFAITFVRVLDDYDRKKDEIFEASRKFLRWYSRFLAGEPPKSIDEAIIQTLHNHIRGIASTTGLISLQAKTYVVDTKYRRRFDEWLADKSWTDPAGNAAKLEEYCSVLSRQFLYIFVNKVLFYHVLRTRYPREIPELTLPPSSSGEDFHSILEKYLEIATNASHDYETVFRTNFIDKLPLPTDTVEELVRLARYLSTLDFSSIGYDIIGRVFEKIIPQEERHALGQYFTPSGLVDLLLSFCLKDPSSVVLDPACGSGTFLVRSYYRLRYLDGKLSHPELLARLWGIDIDKFPAHLATINLAIRDLSEYRNYPNVVYKDFFDVAGPESPVTIGVRPTLSVWTGETTRATAAVTGLDDQTLNREIPEVSVIVGNPPYTRQEELTEDPFGVRYKQKLEDRIAADFPSLSLGRRSGIYSYFFPHGTKFLRRGGRLGFVCLRAWLDTRYGLALKQFLLDHFKIVAIIESGAERWFEDAQMLPVIVVLELSNSRTTREGNMARFVRLNVPLKEIVPPISSDREMLQEVHRWKAVDAFTSEVEAQPPSIEEPSRSPNYGGLTMIEDTVRRIVAIPQGRLRDETKWGKYLSAPSVLFRVIESSAGKLVPLDTVANVKLGTKTGANDFFCLPGRSFEIRDAGTSIVAIRKDAGVPTFEIDKGHLRPVVVKIKPHKEIALSKSDGYILAIAESPRDLAKLGGGVRDYIRYGETAEVRLTRGRDKGRSIVGYQNVTTVATRNPWYDLRLGAPPHIIFPSIFLGRHVVFWNGINAQITNAHFGVTASRKKDAKVICAYLNSSLCALLTEYSGRYIENRDRTISNQIMVFEVEKIPVLDPSKLSEKNRVELESAFDELCQIPLGPHAMFNARDLGNKERLDQVVCCDILGLSKRDLSEIRSSLASIVKTRIDRAAQGASSEQDSEEAED